MQEQCRKEASVPKYLFSPYLSRYGDRFVSRQEFLKETDQGHFGALVDVDPLPLRPCPYEGYYYDGVNPPAGKRRRRQPSYQRICNGYVPQTTHLVNFADGSGSGKLVQVLN